MLVTLIPLFDENMKVSAYSLFTQKKNFLLNPSFLGSGQNDGASTIGGLEVIQSMGIETLSSVPEIFVPINNISIFSDIGTQCDVPHERLVLLLDSSIPPTDMYISRLTELKKQGYHLALRKLSVSNYEAYKELLVLMDYILINTEEVDISKARIYFNKLYPHLKLCASNVKTMEAFNSLKQDKSCFLFEGAFFRLPVTKGATSVSPLKYNYIELINLVSKDDYDLTKAADIIGHDTALVISLLQMVNHMTLNSEVTSIRHAAAMLGQKELKRWITTAVVHQMCSDKPNEITRLSLLRAKFAENLASVFEQAVKSPELFLMGLFSVLDIILDKPMEEALNLVTVSSDIREALIHKKGEFADVLTFMTKYENADWQEVSRLMLLKNIDTNDVYQAYIDSLKWYRELFPIS